MVRTHSTLAPAKPLGINPTALLSNMVEGGGFEPPKLARQIYSLIPLATREPLQEGAHSRDVNLGCQQISMGIPCILRIRQNVHTLTGKSVSTDERLQGRWAAT